MIVSFTLFPTMSSVRMAQCHMCDKQTTRQLPCGDPLCEPCETALATSGNGSFDCPTCRVEITPRDYQQLPSTPPPIPKRSPNPSQPSPRFLPQWSDQRGSTGSDEDPSEGVVILQGPKLPPRIIKPPLQRSSTGDSRPRSPPSGYAGAQAQKTATLPRRLPTVKLQTKPKPAPRRAKTETDIRVDLSAPDDKRIGNVQREVLIPEIGEKYNAVQEVTKTRMEELRKVVMASDDIKDMIKESWEESKKNVNRIEKRLLKEVRVRSKREDCGAEIVYNAQLAFSALEQEAEQLLTAEGMSDQEVIRRGLEMNKQFEILLRQEVVNETNQEVLFMEDYTRLSVGSFIRKSNARCAGIVGINDRLAIVVADHRSTLGVCFGLWSKISGRCIQWEVVFQPKDRTSPLVVCQTMGVDADDNPVVVLGIDESLYFVPTDPVFSTNFEVSQVCEPQTIKLRLGSQISSVVTVKGQRRHVAVGCGKTNSLHVADCSRPQNHIVHHVHLNDVDLLHLCFVATIGDSYEFGVILKTDRCRESFSAINQDGVVLRTMPKISVADIKDAARVIPISVSLLDNEGDLEIAVLFSNRVASCQFYKARFDYNDLTPMPEAILPVSTGDQIPMGMSTLPGTADIVLIFTNSETHVITE